MKPKVVPVLEQCVEKGVKRGYYRSFKHNENPKAEVIMENVQTAIMEELHEWFEFDLPTYE